MIRFRWDPCPDTATLALLTNYKIYDNTTLIATVSSNTLEHTYSVTTPGQSFMISIQSVSLIGDGYKKSLQTLIWAAETPSAPTLTITNTSRDSCSLQW